MTYYINTKKPSEGVQAINEKLFSQYSWLPHIVETDKDGNPLDGQTIEEKKSPVRNAEDKPMEGNGQAGELPAESKPAKTRKRKD